MGKDGSGAAAGWSRSGSVGQRGWHSNIKPGVASGARKQLAPATSKSQNILLAHHHLAPHSHSFLPSPSSRPCPSLQAGPHSAQDVDFALVPTRPTTTAPRPPRQLDYALQQRKASVKHGFLRRQDPLARAAPRHRHQRKWSWPPPAQQDRAPPPPGAPAHQHHHLPDRHGLRAAHDVGEDQPLDDQRGRSPYLLLRLPALARPRPHLRVHALPAQGQPGHLQLDVRYHLP